MRILILVISSDTFPVYAKHRQVWAQYMKRFPNVECYFITYSPMVFVPTFSQDRCTLYLRGNEGYGTIIGKTIDALRFFDISKYTYVVRTNLSSLWDFYKLVDYLQDKPRSRFYSGQIGTNTETGVQFASGAGFIMSPDVCQILRNNKSAAVSFPGFDDVAVAKILRDHGIYPISQPRVDFISLKQYEEHHDKVPEGSFHYRIKHENYLGDRMEEPIIMKKIVDSIYK